MNRHSNEIDPELLDFIDFLEGGAAKHRASHALSLPERRRIAEDIRRPLAAGGPKFDDTRDYRVSHEGGELKVRIINAARGEARPALVYLHGGGWMMFSVDTHDRLMREFAERAGIAVAGIEYSLSPEVRYPAQLNEIQAVLSWLQTEGPQVGIDPGCLALGGDSAGANLAIASCLRMRDAGRLEGIRGMVLCYGVYDGRFDTPSYRRYADPRYVLSREEMLEFWRCYVRSPADYEDPLVSPLRADVSGLPPAFMIITERDVLHDENVRMAEKLRAAGVDVSSTVYPGTVHSFLEAVSFASISDRALGDAARWLKERLRSS